MRRMRWIILVVCGMAAVSNLAGASAEMAATHAMPLHAMMSAAAQGTLHVRTVSILGDALESRVELYQNDERKATIDVPDGERTANVAAGTYEADVYIYNQGVPYLSHHRTVTIGPGQRSELEVEMTIGATELTPLRNYDQDHDLALDEVELKMGTNPRNPSDIPRQTVLTIPTKAISPKPGWYRGELHAHSSHGRGQESVKELIQRAEQQGLDFLAITDRNTMAATKDPDFQSDELVLIPAMEWGNEKRGFGLVYGPRTLPPETNSLREAQAIANRVQYQGGLFAVAHPCFPRMGGAAPWQWGLSYVNAIEVWCRGWRDVPGISLNALEEYLTTRKNGRLIHSLALAVANPLSYGGKKAPDAPILSANAQALRFYDYELTRGLKATPIAGSNTASPKVPMGEPVTHIYAKELSAPALLEGLRLGRTFVSREVDGPEIYLKADYGLNGKLDIGEGGMLPLSMETEFWVTVKGAKGKEVELLENGHPIRSVDSIKTDNFTFSMRRTPNTYGAYRAMVYEKPDKPGFGPREVLALSGTIYAQEVLVYDPTKGPEQLTFRLDSEVNDRNQQQPAPSFEDIVRNSRELPGQLEEF